MFPLFVRFAASRLVLRGGGDPDQPGTQRVEVPIGQRLATTLGASQVATEPARALSVYALGRRLPDTLQDAVSAYWWSRDPILGHAATLALLLGSRVLVEQSSCQMSHRLNLWISHVIQVSPQLPGTKNWLARTRFVHALNGQKGGPYKGFAEVRETP